MKIPDAPPRAEVVMTDGWKILEVAIPRGESDAIAAMIGQSSQAVRSWRREPEAGDELATGRRSALDQLLLLLNAVYARNPEGAELIVDRINSEIANLRRIHGRNDFLPLDQAEGELRAAARKINSVADAVAGVRGNERL